MIYLFQEGWMLDWLKQAFTPGVALAFVGVAVLTWRATTDYGRLNRLENILSEVVTKKDLDITISKMEKALMGWADGRFLSKDRCALIEEQRSRTEERQDQDIQALFNRSGESDRG